MSGHHWGATESKPRGPSDFLCEVKDIIDTAAAAGSPCGEVEHWAPNPADGEPKPVARQRSLKRVWPADPLGRAPRRRRAGAAGDRGGRGCRRPAPAARAAEDPRGLGRPTSTPCWPNGSRIARPPPVESARRQLSVSALVELDRDPATAARRLTRRLPSRPDPHAILGTAFHDWVQRFYGAERLFDLDDLPGAGDPRSRSTTERLAALQEAFRHLAVGGPHPDRRGGALRDGDRRHHRARPHRRGVRRPGRRDRPSSTGRPANRPPTRMRAAHAAVQLAVYRLAVGRR